jgi:hypothetical protein
MITANGASASAITVTDPTQKLNSLQLKVNERTISVQLPMGVETGSVVMVE